MYLVLKNINQNHSPGVLKILKILKNKKHYPWSRRKYLHNKGNKIKSRRICKLHLLQRQIREFTS